MRDLEKCKKSNKKYKISEKIVNNDDEDDSVLADLLEPNSSKHNNESLTKVFRNNCMESQNVYSFEEAVTLTGTGKFHTFLFIICGLCIAETMVQNQGIGMIMSLIICDLKPTLAQQGFLASSNLFGIVLSSHAMGFLADTWGRSKTLKLSLALSFITTIVSALALNTWMLILIRLLNGIFVSACQSCVYSYLGEFHGSKTRLVPVTMLDIFDPLSSIYMPAMAVGVYSIHLNMVIFGLRLTSWRMYFLATSSLSLFILSGLCFLPESPKYELIQGKHEECLKILQKVFRLNTGRPEYEYPVKKVYEEISGSNINNVHGIKDGLMLVWNQTMPMFCRKRVLHSINICFIIFVIVCIAQGTYIWLPTILDQLASESAKGYSVCQVFDELGSALYNSTDNTDSCEVPENMQNFLIMTVIGVAFSIMYVILVFIVEKVGQRKVLVIYFAATAICCLILKWTYSFYLSVILLTLVISIANLIGVVNSITVEYYPTNISGMAMCLTMMMSSLGGVTGSNVLASAIFSNCGLLLYVATVGLAIISFLSAYLPEEARNN